MFCVSQFNLLHMPKTNLQQHIFIDALPSKVWKVLTSCDYIKQYLLDGMIHCLWKEGGEIVVKKETEEKTVTIYTGNVLQVVPGVLLKYNLVEESTDSFTTVTYELIPAGSGIELKFCNEGFFNTGEDYSFRINETKLLLQKIKWLAEYA